MRILLFLLLSVAFNTALDAQALQIHRRGGTKHWIETTSIDSIEFTKTAMRVRMKGADHESKTYLHASTDSVTLEPQMPIVEKVTAFPRDVWNVTRNNNYQLETSQFCIQRMMENDNIAAFWEADFGADPEKCSVVKYRFPLRDIMQEANKMYEFYRDSLRFVVKGNSVSDTKRVNLYFFYSDEGTVYGGGTESEKIGCMWITPNRVQYGPYGAIAHELGHSFQQLSQYDGGSGFSGAGGQMWEMTSQFMLWQYYPTWITFEKYHLDAFMQATHLPFMHPDNQYHSSFVLEWWANLRGRDYIGYMWRKAKSTEDPVQCYKRLTGLTQDEFCDELCSGYMHFITWDWNRVRTASRSYINQHVSPALTSVGDGWYRIAASKCPQNYGYNAIRLNSASARGKTVKVELRSAMQASGYSCDRPQYAGWRYGLVAYCSNGQRVYSSVCSDSDECCEMQVPSSATYLWLVVMGAPTTHWAYSASIANQWPYDVKFSGTTKYN